MKSGIYKITNKFNGKVYIGVSRDINRRRKDHYYDLKSRSHTNSRLQNDCDLLGLESFNFEVLEFCPVNELYEKEKHYIKKFNSYYEGYNMTTGGDGSYGHVVSEETRKHLSEINKGENNPNWGRKISPEHKAKLIAASIGRIPSTKGKKRPKWIGKKISETLKGRKLSEEHRKSLSKAIKGKQNINRRNILFTEESRRLSSESHKGIKLSEEVKGTLAIANCGENTNFSKLKEVEVIEMKIKFLKGEKQSVLAKEFNVTRSSVCGIVNGKTWKYLPRALEELVALKRNYKTQCNNGIRKNLTEKDVICMRIDFLNGMSQVEISEKYNVDRKNICKIVHNQRWKHIPNTIKKLERFIEA